VTVPATGVAPGPVTVNVPALSAAAFIGSLKVAVTREFTGTAVAALAGVVEMTVGGPVVKLHTKLAASGLPPGSFAPVVMVAVYSERAASEAVGVKTAVLPE
jgi:hypothetical protein